MALQIVLLLLLAGCQSVQLQGTTVSCQEVISCSGDNCIKQYKGNDCLPEQKAYYERRYPSIH